ncbi:fimbrial protein [Huaxiibacter chinensis]
MKFGQFFSGVLFCCLLIVSPSGKVSAKPGEGSLGIIEVGGNIIESACAIHPDSHQQRLILNDISADTLIRRGFGELHPFTIKLFNCSLERTNGSSWLGFEITFNGEADGNNFALMGDAQGLAVEISDDRGFIAKPGIALPPHPVPQGEKALIYYVRLVGNDKLLRGGSHFTSLNYKLDYY